ncbi:SpoIID/LytB domain-containing protein [Myxococcus stipitatus]|uniref:SpoIID/LytB domain-containing protein n=1 Tax=Myxococcus stipitatus TaxID=83455 RepID=UPI001F17D8EF|nr:SpoIID/LytB domain-containing protein [Myxococcus stipitatus]MCE9669080.1 SpoIID/LytB domain-containing protein [Myxococcus stipitatus]
MGWAAMVAALLAATPTFVTRGDVTPEPELRREAEAGWAALEAVYVARAGGAPAKAPGAIVLQRGVALPPERNAQGRPGLVELRQNAPGVLDARLRLALRHELAHQLLWWACPQSSEDRLFHEAFALAVSGELPEWRDAPYQSLSRAAADVASSPAVDSPRARRALARLLGESVGFPQALSRRLRQCHDGARWVVPLSIDELADVQVRAAGPATVVVSRHSGEVLLSEGDVRRALPYGSALKPFVYAAGVAHPELSPRAEAQEWACGPRLPEKVDARTALLRSCNGYFLDWEARGSAPKAFGAWGPVLSAVGLTGTPVDMADAIGLRSTLALSPWGMAQAFRLLAEARPDVVALLSDNAARGTLAELPASKALVGVATKTGTVRDAASRPRYGWIAAVDADLVVVAVRPGRMPRSFAEEVPEAMARARKQAGLEAARVQVLGLLASKDVEARCGGAGFSVEEGAPRAAPVDWARLEGLTARGAAVCLGAPWRVRFPKGPEGGRDYAGVFTWSTPPAYRPPPGVPTSPSAMKARRGSDFVFRTTRLQYTAGVVAAEDVTLKGEARVALARVVAHNERHSRHPGRPVCDTTHCQAFQGTVRVQRDETRALGLPPLRWREWLLFSQGGQAPWRETRPRGEVERLLGKGLVSLRFESGKVNYLLTTRDGEATYQDGRSLPCEVLRSGLRLPACPRVASFDGSVLVFEGRGRGHGEGLDVEAAKASGQGSDEILERAYGRERPVPRDVDGAE